MKDKMKKTGLLIASGFVLCSLVNCGGVNNRAAFDPKTCMEDVPEKVEGVKVITGPRTEANIINDMQSPYCNGQMLFKLLNDRGQNIAPGTAVFKVSVEYNGEAIAAEVADSTIDSEVFLEKVRGMIMDTDFSPWQRHDEDAIFVYPITFTRWWE